MYLSQIGSTVAKVFPFQADQDYIVVVHLHEAVSCNQLLVFTIILMYCCDIITTACERLLTDVDICYNLLLYDEVLFDGRVILIYLHFYGVISWTNLLVSSTKFPCDVCMGAQLLGKDPY